jgi:hypothetical protein
MTVRTTLWFPQGSSGHKKRVFLLQTTTNVKKGVKRIIYRVRTKGPVILFAIRDQIRKALSTSE